MKSYNKANIESLLYKKQYLKINPFSLSNFLNFKLFQVATFDN